MHKIKPIKLIVCFDKENIESLALQCLSESVYSLDGIFASVSLPQTLFILSLW